jgi:four helix bundle protein
VNDKQRMTNGEVYDRAYQFAIRMINAYKYLCNEKHELILSKKLLRSGTRIGANIAQADGAISDVEFSAKMSMAYQECLETKYWLCLLKDTGYITSEVFDSVLVETEVLSKLLSVLVASGGDGS